MNKYLVRGMTFKGDWIYGSLHIDTISSTGNKCYIDSRESLYNPTYTEVKTETVGRITDCVDVDGHNIWEGDTVEQKSVLVGDKEFNFTGEVMFREGMWVLDNGDNCIPLWTDTRENKIIK